MEARIMFVSRVSRAAAGGALVLSVIAVVVVSILAAGFFQLATGISRRLGSNSDTIQALNVAEAGLAEAYNGLGVAHTGNVGTEDTPAFFGGGLFWVEAEHHADGLVELTSNAMYGTGRASLGMVCDPVEVGFTSLGIFTDDDLRLNPDVRFDSYDSALGTYGDQVGTPLNNKGILGSNGSISVASGNLVFGDVIYGPTGTLNVANGSTITGNTSARPNLEELPPIDVPEVPLQLPVKYVSATPLVVPPGEAGFQSLEMTKDTKLVLKGPLTMVVGSLTLRLGSEMLFDTTDGPIKLHVTESLDFNTDSLVSTSTQVTSDSLIMVSAPEGKTVSFGAKSQFYGFIYAPYATAHFAATYEVYGGVVCKELQLAAQGRMHCDLALGPTLESMLPDMTSWRVVEMPTEAAVNRLDPFHLLGVEPADLRSPADAHEDQVLDIRYYNQNGAESSYFGLESQFDWSLVKELIYGARDSIAFFLPEDYGAGVPTLTPDPNVELVASELNSKQLRDALLAASPVSAEALVAACLREPPMASGDLKSVLDSQGVLSTEVLLAAVDSDALSSSALASVLVASSPLSAEVLSAALVRNPPLTSKDLKKLLSLQ